MDAVSWQRPAVGAMEMPADFRYYKTLMAGRPKHTPYDAFRLKHPEMETGHRAKIFAPFDALKGFKEAVAAKRVLYEPRREISEEERSLLDRKFSILHNMTWNSRMARLNSPLIRIRYFVPCRDPNSFWFDDGKNPMAGGQYLELTGICRKVDADDRKIIQVDTEIIPLQDVLAIEDAEPDRTGDLFGDSWPEPDAC